jgi:hypothetical protein
MGSASASSLIRGASLISLCVIAFALVPVDASSTSAEFLALMSGIPDTTAAAVSDTARAGPKNAVWPMDELKRVLVEETGGLGAGARYEERKSGRVAMVCALLVPGLGQMYNERPIKAAIALGVETFYLSHVFMNRRFWDREKDIRDAFPVASYEWRYHDRWVKEYWERSVDWIWWSSAVVLAVVIDAYVDAHLDDMRFRIEPRVEERGAAVSLVVPY